MPSFRLGLAVLVFALATPLVAGASPPPPADAKPTDPCSALHSAEYISPAITTANVDVGDNAMACGRAYLAQAPEFAGALFFEAGDAYAKAAELRTKLADDGGPLRDAQRSEATLFWGLAWRAYSLAARLNVSGASVLADTCLTHVPAPR